MATSKISKNNQPFFKNEAIATNPQLPWTATEDCFVVGMTADYNLDSLGNLEIGGVSVFSVYIGNGAGRPHAITASAYCKKGQVVSGYNVSVTAYRLG